jgi:hypothetical protein
MFSHESLWNGVTQIPHRSSTFLHEELIRRPSEAIQSHCSEISLMVSSAQKVFHHVHELPHASANANPCRRVAFADGTWRGTSLNCCPHPAGGITIDRVHLNTSNQRAQHTHIAR